MCLENMLRKIQPNELNSLILAHRCRSEAVHLIIVVTFG
jgi:hypothetical protein